MNIKEKKWKLYRHINKENGKMYIGITSTKFKNRWRSGKGYSGVFASAINKYGWDNFYHEVLTTNGFIVYTTEKEETLLYFTKEEVKQKEIDLIKEYKTLSNEHGYNVSKGGDLSGRVNSRKVFQYDLQGKFIKEWNSVADIERDMNLNSANISACCLDKCVTAGNFVWSYKKINKNKVLKKVNNKGCIYNIIYQYSKDCKFIKQWNNISEITEILGYNKNAIYNNCNKKTSTSYNFVWSYTKLTKKQVLEQSKYIKYIYQYNKEGVLIKKWDNLEQIINATNFNSRPILYCLKNCQLTAYEFVWSYTTLNKKEIQKRNIKTNKRIYY